MIHMTSYEVIFKIVSQISRFFRAMIRGVFLRYIAFYNVTTGTEYDQVAKFDIDTNKK